MESQTHLNPSAAVLTAVHSPMSAQAPQALALQPASERPSPALASPFANSRHAAATTNPPLTILAGRQLIRVCPLNEHVGRGSFWIRSDRSQRGPEARRPGTQGGGPRCS